jgi:hypothetical protein
MSSRPQRFAEGTPVPVEKSQSEIITLLKKRGARDHFMGSKDGDAFLAFWYRGLPVRLMIRKPDPKVYRNPDAIDRETRRLWRVLLIWVKGQLEAIENDLLTPYSAFMSHLQLGDGRTVAEAAQQDGGLKLGPNLQLPAPTGDKS